MRRHLRVGTHIPTDSPLFRAIAVLNSSIIAGFPRWCNVECLPRIFQSIMKRRTIFFLTPGGSRLLSLRSTQNEEVFNVVVDYLGAGIGCGHHAREIRYDALFRVREFCGGSA